MKVPDFIKYFDIIVIDINIDIINAYNGNIFMHAKYPRKAVNLILDIIETNMTLNHLNQLGVQYEF